ncbi:MAG: dihydroxyacetone kinase subunit L [Acidobacteria bacterium]|nr:dihydroxyacetone kinase subunit L [Acidobacteriota bacterium]
MASHGLSVEKAGRWLVLVSLAMAGEEERLTRADQAVGDGDHGIGISRGFRAVREKLEPGGFPSLEALVGAAGKALLMSIGGASGPIFGSLFLSGSKRLAGRTVFDAQCLADLLEGGLQAIQERGKAQVGDKTLVDALQPAAEKARAMRGESLNAAFQAIVEAARKGLESTRNLKARHGKARALGERAIGHVDPGALSLTLMLEHMARLAAEVTGQE